LPQLNGLMIPGGGATLINNRGFLTHFAKKGLHLLEEAEKLNINGTYFPVWGTCLGFELISIYHAKGKNILSNFEGGYNHFSNV
jgi:gamma-glutamyl hydrolase